MEKTILIVDDEPSIVTLLAYNLNQAGYKTITAEDGKAGLETALETKPDLNHSRLNASLS